MDRVYFDMGVFTFWSEESLDNKRLIAKGGVLVSDDAALKEVMDGSDPLDMDLVEMLTNQYRRSRIFSGNSGSEISFPISSAPKAPGRLPTA